MVHPFLLPSLEWSFLYLSLIRNLFIHVDVLPPLPDFLVIRMNHSWVWRRWSLKVLPGPSSPVDCLPWDSCKKTPKQARVCSFQVQDCGHSLCIFSTLSGHWIPPSHDHYSQVWPRFSLPWPVLPCLQVWDPTAQVPSFVPQSSVSGSCCQSSHHKGNEELAAWRGCGVSLHHRRYLRPNWIKP